MARLPVGTELKTQDFKTLTVLEELGQGGQGTVYRVDYQGQPKALKWYHERTFAGRKKPFYDNLVNNVRMGAPSPAFLWPLDVTEFAHGAVGYVMDLRPPDYVVMTRYLLRQQFKSFRVCADAMLGIANAFRLLHNKGYSYQDLNDGNFFIHPETGDVRICDNDNVAPFGTAMGVQGKSRYMAPEVVLGQRMPDKQSDRFSMALILFMLLCKAHPLEGACSTPPCLTPSIERRIYGESPIFIFDPENPANRPIKGIHTNAITMWPELPDYLQDAFVRAFSKQAMTFDPALGGWTAQRVLEREWIDLLVRFRNSILQCPACPNQELAGQPPHVCSRCGAPMGVPGHIRVGGYAVPAVPGVQIYRCQLGNCPDDVATQPVAQVVAHPKNPGMIGLRNCSGETWLCHTTTGESRPLPHGEAFPVKAGIRAEALGGLLEII